MPGRAGRNRARDPFNYWNNTAPTKPEAQALAARLGLDFPSNSPHGYQCGLVYPIRRLIVTGEDSPENYAILLGPLWETKAMNIIKETRIEVLKCPPVGSPSYKVAGYVDQGAPRWTPKPLYATANAVISVAPTPEEEAQLAEVRSMSDVINQHMGEKKNVQNSDVKDMLTSMGSDWGKNLGAFQSAMNARNQGV
ncbi:uncharacterized protein KY384_002834 [Bacidia gigantensis]|uniref:uncharacterized protein n=1 Tax=Bacidia gigantensis TaxID=2732470 RepID=UPI001D059C73|nr:uncharacterized protein KY384_002834 [Bacidia gigantensis]KAG8532349.1 hypothetical protein KY384_002834 [Bacidia gigantensis]